MKSKKSKPGFASKLFIVLIITFLAIAVYLYIDSQNNPTPTDPYFSKLESFNEQIYGLPSVSKIASLRTEIQELENQIKSDPDYSHYADLTQAQLATLDALEPYYLYLDEARTYSSKGIDCKKDYSSIISELRGAESQVTTALSKVDSYLNSNPDSNATLLKKRLQSIDVTGMDGFAYIFENVYRLDCPSLETPTTTYVTPISKQDAIELTIKEVVKSNDYYVYSVSDSPLPKGTVIGSMRPGDFHNRTLDSDAWFFYVDTEPLAPFAHQTYFVFIDLETAEFSVYNESYYPVIDGISYFSMIDERMDNYSRVYPEGGNLSYDLSSKTYSGKFSYKLSYPAYAIADIPFGTSVPFEASKCCDGVGEKHALVITGYDEPMFRGDTEAMYNYLSGQGFSDANIIYLTASSGDSPNSDGKTTLAAVANAFSDLAQNTECCDEVFIYLSGHGGNVWMWQWRNTDTGQTVWVPWNVNPGPDMTKWTFVSMRDSHEITINPEFLTSRFFGGKKKHGSSRGGTMLGEDIAALLDSIDSCDMTIMYFSCFSGTASTSLRGKGRTIITPVSGANVAWGYTGHWLGSHEAGSIFSQHFVNAKTDASLQNVVDSDGDGTISDREAFDYARIQTANDVNNLNGGTQLGTWTAPDPCKCCYVRCGDSFNCEVVEGEGTDSPNCVFVGDYCGPIGGACGNGYINIGEECESDADCSFGEVCRDCKCIAEGMAEPVCGDGLVNGIEECEQNSDCPGTEVCIDCVCFGDIVVPSCGDGIITPPELCDPGNVATNKCPAGQYCDSCDCKPLDVSAICGDGSIGPGEECDPGNAATERCDHGKECTGCKCIEIGLETHTECSDSACVVVDGPGTSVCTSDADCEEQYHRACSGYSCVLVEGLGSDECSSDADCELDEPVCGDGEVEGAEECETNAQCSEGQVCSSCRCIEEEYCGDGKVEGNEECENNADCSEDQKCSGCRCVEDDPECGDGEVEAPEECEGDGDCGERQSCSSCRCVDIEGYCGDSYLDPGEECENNAECGELGVCSSCRCVYPPDVDCGDVCAEIEGTQSFGNWHETAEECSAYVYEYYQTYVATECMVACSYAAFTSVTNVAGTATCCCGMVKDFNCENCPCEAPCDPLCPDPASTCETNAPSWYVSE